MLRTLKTAIKQRANLYYWLTMSVGPFVRLTYFQHFITRYQLRHDLSFLDAGFGRGEHLHWLEQNTQNCLFVGYDLGSTDSYLNNFAQAQGRLKLSDLHKQDLKTMSDQDRFDVIFTIDVLEHIPENQIVIENLYRALKPSGILYLALPYDDPQVDYILPRRWLQRFISWADDEHIGEMRSLAEMLSVLTNTGFSVMEAQYTFAKPTRLLWEIQQVLIGRSLPIHHALCPLFNLIAMLEFLLPKPSAGNLRIVARKP
jgi:SAM-dependent methyltransferase